MSATNPNFLEDFSDLEALLDEAETQATEAKRLKVLQKKVFAPNATLTEREELAKQIHEIELKVIWQPVAQVACFRRQLCICGSQHQIFEAFMVEMKHRTLRDTVRFAAIAHNSDGLPKKVIYHDSSTSVCQDCAGMWGWEFATAEVHCTTSAPVIETTEGEG
jgi:hypothetical protein